MPGVATGDELSAEARAAVRVVRINLPLRHPHVAAHGVESTRDLLLVRVTRPDGFVGWGECPTLTDRGYGTETTELAWAALVEGGELGPMAAGALADAQLDASLRAGGRSLAAWIDTRLGDPVRRSPGSVPFGEVFGLDRMPTAPAGFVKLKITPTTVERLRTVRDRYPQLSIAADANGSFGSVEAVPTWLDDIGLAYLEQPFAPDDLIGHAQLRSRGRTPIALDESIATVDDLAAAAALGALDVVSLKPARVGGVESAVALLARARGLGLGAFVGGMLESAIGRAGALALAATRGINLPTDLGPSSRYFETDVADAIVEVDGRLVVPEGPGIGRVPDPDRLAELTVTAADLAGAHLQPG